MNGIESLLIEGKGNLFLTALLVIEGEAMFERIKKIVLKLVAKWHGQRLLTKLRPDIQGLIKRVRMEKLTYLPRQRLASLSSTCNAIENSQLPGIFIEAGCALGGSSILIAALKDKKRPLFIYDVFGVIPPPTEEDTKEVHERYQAIVQGSSQGIGGNKYYGYEENLYEVVRSNFRDFGIDCENQSVSLIRGLVQETMNINQPVAFAHVDVDWYDPVKTCLERIFPNLVSGGCIILDDYHDWGGCRKATDEFLSAVVGQFSLDDSTGSMKITKTS